MAKRKTKLTGVQLYDTTLRDGAGREGISFSVTDKLGIARKLDELGIHFIEGGWPGSNPKDMEFFAKARKLKLKNSTLVAFGSTRRADSKVENDENIKALLDADVKAVTIVGKSSAPQVTQVLQTTLEENIDMVADSIRYLKSKGLTVFLDAEHYFDGFKVDPAYSLHVLGAASEAGADCLVLCDTNGGTMPDKVVTAIEAAQQITSVPMGIHAHNDSEMAVANSLIAINAGATQVQGTINGYGERCGNANLCSIIPALKLKMDINCISDTHLAKLTEVSHYLAEIANLSPDPFLPYVGASAFSHKAGLHIAGLRRWIDAYQHIDPARVGNQAKILVSELSGKGTVIQKAKERGIDLPPKGKEAQKVLEQIKQLENRGFQYDNAEASFELLVRRAKDGYHSPFELVDFMVVVENRRRSPTQGDNEEILSEAVIKVRVNSEIMHTAAEGNGPVNALDQALRKALMQFYPSLSQIKLVDYKVRILEESGGTGSLVRVLIESTDGSEEWRTVGSSANIIEASWLALADSLEYWLLKHKH